MLQLFPRTWRGSPGSGAETKGQDKAEGLQQRLATALQEQVGRGDVATCAQHHQPQLHPQFHFLILRASALPEPPALGAAAAVNLPADETTEVAKVPALMRL